MARPGRPPLMLLPDALEREYRVALRALVAEFAALTRAELLARLPDIAAQRDRLVRADADGGWSGRIEAAVMTIKMAMDASIRAMERRVIDIGNKVAAFNRAQWGRVVQAAVGVDIFRGEPWLADQIASFAAENAQLIRSLPEDALRQIEGIAQRGVRTGRSAGDISREIEERFGATRRRADLIARDQVSKLNGQLTELRQRQAGVTTYYWRTSRDERVREAHDVLEGKLCRWDDPTVYSDDGGATWKPRSAIGADEQHPGQPVSCRCSAESNVAEVLEALGI